MIKTPAFTYGPMEIPTGIAPSSVYVHLITSSGILSQAIDTPYGTPSVEFNVPAGNGWKIRVFNKAAFDVTLSMLESDPFDVVETQTVQVVTGVTVS